MMDVERIGILGLLARALLTGLVASLALALLTLVFADDAHAQAAQTASATGAAGLRLYAGPGAPGVAAPQLRTEVSIRVTGMLARVRVVQRFRNPGAAWVEGSYVFPLPENAAVDRLQMRYAGRLIEGQIEEKQQARRTYEAARARGQGAGLLDQQRANLFTTAVANIPPAGEVQIAIEYQQQVHWDAGEFSLRFPMVVGPRYIPGAPLVGTVGRSSARQGWADDTDQVPDASQITPPVIAGAADDVNPLALQAELDVGLPLDEIASPYHIIDVERMSAGRYQVRLRAGEVPAERDFVLRWRPQLEQQPRGALFAETWQGRQYGLLMLMPPAPAALPPAPPRELILVVDTSGSMHGDSIEQARSALSRALRLLRPGDRFNLIRFSDRTEALFERAVPASSANLDRARTYVAGLQAEGGTEMLPAMRRALQGAGSVGMLRQVVFLTDGAVGNEEALFKAVADDLGDSRLFTVGIGSAPNALFMRKAAAFGRGSFTYIGSTAEVADKVGALFGKLSAPALTDLQVRWLDADGDARVVQSPAAAPDLYAGEPLVLAVEAASLPRRALIEGRLGGQPWRHVAVLDGGARGRGIHALWARGMIEDWLAQLQLGATPEAVRAAVLELALGHRLVSRYTSLVAVDRTPSRPDSAGLASAAVPTRLPAGWSAEAVFGRLPSTATPALLYLMVGVALITLTFAARRWA